MGYASRITRAANRGAKANKVFENLENEFLTAAQEAREVHDELQVEIERLLDLQKSAETLGVRNQQRAARVRETFL